jgi:DNA mismatch repair protein MutS2
MAQAGLQIPAAEGSLVTAFRSVYADIGDEQSIEQSLSTFSSHVSHIVEMLRGADDRSLVLLDELGAGTDPQEGSALARAILEHLRQRRVYCVATTHYSDLKLYAHAAPRVENASVEFDPRTLSPTYRLLVGLPGRSNALEIAARLGVPRVILERARSVLRPSELEASSLLDQIQEERKAASDARILAERERQAAEQVRARLERELAEQERGRQQVWREAEDSSRRLLAELRDEVAAIRAEAQRGRTDRAHAEQVSARAQELRPITAPAPVVAEWEEPGPAVADGRPLTIGSEVVVPSLGVPGRITRLEPDEVEVDVRGMRVRLRPDELAGAREVAGHERRGPAAEPTTRVILQARDQTVPLQLDLRGQRRDEAAQELDRYLNEAYLAGLKAVRVVHGKGTGAVRQAVHELLGNHPLVKRYSAAAREAGGDGATEVELVA